jgi:hypothetical protein
MRKGLLRAYWLLGLFALGAVGCTTDSRDYVVTQTQTHLDDATKKLAEINTALQKVVEIGKTSKGLRLNNPEVVQRLSEAKASAEALIKLGREVQNIKGLAERLSAKATPESKKELRELNRARFEEYILKLDATDRELIVTLAEADRLAAGDASAKRELKNLREEVQKGREVFEVLTKRR